jgi:hypothetical protein
VTRTSTRDDAWTRPLPTPYLTPAGELTRFRSRLEARWAVFFDVLGVAWTYEPERHKLPASRPDGSAFTSTYLPDFWVQARTTGGDAGAVVGLWVEVKGSVEQLGECTDRYTRFLLEGALQAPLVLLGPLTRPDQPRPWHWVYERAPHPVHGAPEIVRYGARFTDAGTVTTAGPAIAVVPGIEATEARHLTPSIADPWSPWSGSVWHALNAARRARFDSNGHARIGTRTVAEYRAERVLTGRHPAISAWSVLT